MNSSLSLSSILAPFTKFFGKYHATIFFTLIVLLLAVAILVLYLSVQNPKAPDTPSEVISSSFDEKTVEEIKTLRESKESSRDLVFPTPRSNAFVE